MEECANSVSESMYGHVADLPLESTMRGWLPALFVLVPAYAICEVPQLEASADVDWMKRTSLLVMSL